MSVNISYRKCIAKLNPSLNCRFCNLEKMETVSHFILQCPFYRPYREHYLGGVVHENMKDADLGAFLMSLDVPNCKRLFSFVTRSLMLRAVYD